MQAAVIQSLAVRVQYIANAAEALRGILILYGPRDTGTVVGYLRVVEEGAADTAVRYQRVGQRCHRLVCVRRVMLKLRTPIAPAKHAQRAHDGCGGDERGANMHKGLIQQSHVDKV